MPISWFGKNKPSDNPDTPVPPQVDARDKQLFVKCAKCGAILIARDFERDLKVCSKCGYHHPLTADERIAYTVDEGSFVEYDQDLTAVDPLEFPEYAGKLEKGKLLTGRNDTMVRGSATIGGYPVSLLVADFRFMGGSMGAVFGEKFVRAADYAIENRAACVIFVASGGARMQEGLFSLMQMAKTSVAVAQMADLGTPYIVVLTHPTTGGAWASFAALGDVIYSEPNALVAFAGDRVAQQAKQFKEPANYKTAEFQLDFGKIDRIVPRKEMVTTLSRTLPFFLDKSTAPTNPAANGQETRMTTSPESHARNGVGGGH